MEDGRSAEKNFPETPFNKPLEKILGTSVLAEKGAGGSLCSLRNRKDICDFVCFDPASKDHSFSGLILSQEDFVGLKTCPNPLLFTQTSHERKVVVRKGDWLNFWSRFHLMMLRCQHYLL